MISFATRTELLSVLGLSTLTCPRMVHAEKPSALFQRMMHIGGRRLATTEDPLLKYADLQIDDDGALIEQTTDYVSDIQLDGVKSAFGAREAMKAMKDEKILKDPEYEGIMEQSIIDTIADELENGEHTDKKFTEEQMTFLRDPANWHDGHDAANKYNTMGYRKYKFQEGEEAWTDVPQEELRYDHDALISWVNERHDKFDDLEDKLGKMTDIEARDAETVLEQFRADGEISDVERRIIKSMQYKVEQKGGEYLTGAEKEHLRTLEFDAVGMDTTGTFEYDAESLIEWIDPTPFSGDAAGSPVDPAALGWGVGTGVAMCAIIWFLFCRKKCFGEEI